MDWGLGALCQLEVLDLEEPGTPDGSGTSFTTLPARWDFIGDKTFSSTLLEDPGVDFALCACLPSFPFRPVDLVTFLGLAVYPDLTSWGIYPDGYERMCMD